MSDSLSAETAFYRRKLMISIIIPGIFVFFMFLVKFIELIFNIDFLHFGIHPLAPDGIPGIFLSPFIHKDFEHLFNNSLPLFFLSVALFYFYSDVAVKIYFLNYLITGFLVWIAGRNAWHVGASGLVYGLASFLFFSGIIRGYYRLMALSLLVVFLYGEMVWGIFPGTYENVSWESHMLGFFSGIFLSIWFRKEGPQRPVNEWLDDEEPEIGIAQEDDETKGKL